MTLQHLELCYRYCNHTRSNNFGATLRIPDVCAIDASVPFKQNLFGFFAPVYEQAGILVKTLQGTPEAFTVKSIATKLKVSGVNLFSAGNLNAQANESSESDDTPIEKLIYQDHSNHIYQMLNLQGNQLVSADMYGDVTAISSIRQDLLFGRRLVSV